MMPAMIYYTAYGTHLPACRIEAAAGKPFFTNSPVLCHIAEPCRYYRKRLCQYFSVQEVIPVTKMYYAGY